MSAGQQPDNPKRDAVQRQAMKTPSKKDAASESESSKVAARICPGGCGNPVRVRTQPGGFSPKYCSDA